MFFYIKYQGEIIRSPNPTSNSFFENIPFVLSIIIFYISIFLLSLNLNYLKIKKLVYKNYEKIFIITLSYVIFLFFLNSEDYMFGGGIIYKIGSFLNSGILITYIFSVISLIVIFLLINKNINNFLIIVILCIISYEMVYQKYYDPLIFIIFLTLIDSKKIDFAINKELFNIKKLFIIKTIFLISCNLYYI
tara:strand:- start:758 stop:1330 length:573 start_codon:yes stop_codon:yes gene_type:complete